MDKITLKRIKVAVGIILALGIFYYLTSYYPEQVRKKYFREVDEADQFWKNVTK